MILDHAGGIKDPWENAVLTLYRVGMPNGFNNDF